MRRILSIMLAALLTGCAYQYGPDYETVLAPAADVGTAVDCRDGCVDEWQRAQLWLANHSRWKIQTATDVLVQTYNPTGSSPSYGFTVTREPAGDGSYRISIEMACGNLFGCSPAPEHVRRAFLYYVATGRDLLKGENMTAIK